MAGFGFQFNAGEHAERQHALLLPAGWYVVQMVSSEIKPTKKPGGARLNCQFKVLQGDFAGRVIFAGYNVQNDNPVAVQIAMEELAELSRAVGVPVWNDSEMLHGKPFNLKIKVRQQVGYDANNEPQIYQSLSNMEGVTYATKADLASLPKATPASPAGAFGAGAAPAQKPAGFGQQPVQQTQGFQNATVQQQSTVRQAQQPVNFNNAAQAQPWANNAPVQQPVQQQPVQQEQVQQPAQQPSWATQTVQPGTEQPVTVKQEQVQEVPDDIAQAAQAQVPPWKRPVADA